MKFFESHPHWPSVLWVCQQLKQKKFSAWLAGGCVRDALLQRKPNDFDVVTNASPEEVEETFPKSVGVGKAFGVIVIPFDGFDVEVATFRSESSYTDGRRPDRVIFSSPKEDAKRRDFTVNGLFYDVESERIIDYVEGRKDLEANVLRAIGLPHKRFEEDHLRLLRAVRFASQLNFSLDGETYESICQCSHLIQKTSTERIQAEISKILVSQNVSKGLQLLEFTELSQYIFSDVQIDFSRSKNTLEFSLEPENVAWQWALLLKDSVELNFDTQPSSKSIQSEVNRSLGSFFKRWKFSKVEKNEVLNFISAVGLLQQESRLRLGDLLKWFSQEKGERYYKFAKLFSENTLNKWIPVQAVKPLVSAKQIQSLIQGLSGKELGAVLLEIELLQFEKKLSTEEEVIDWVQRREASS